MGLTNSQRHELFTVLNDAFRTSDSLERLTSLARNKTVDQLARGRDLEAILLKIIQRAEEERWLGNLIQTACILRPQDLKLQELTQELQEIISATTVSDDNETSPLHFQPVDFKQEDIFNYYSSFVGRQQELDAVQEFLQGDGGEYLLIQGKAGIGKTALVAKLARMGEAKEFGEQVSCLVFFIREEGGRNTPERFLDALNHQLLRLLGEYEEIPIHLAEKEHQYKRLWEKAETRVSPSNRLLVLIDGLDESARKGRQPLAEYFPATIAPYIYWIATSRPLPDVLDAIPTTHVLRKARSHWLSGLEAQEVLELLALNGDCIKRSDDFVARLIERTNGEPLFLRFLCQNIAEWGVDADAHLDEIPESVSEYFQQQLNLLWERSEHAADRNLIMQILATLLVSLSGLTEKELAGILERKVFEIRESIRLIERFLLGEESYELMHLEFRRTIEEELLRDEDKQEALDALLAYCERSWSIDAPQERYAIRYYLRHLWEKQRYQEMFVLCDAGYLDTKLHRLISPEPMEEDYQLLYDACRKENDLMRLLRWGLHRARIADEAAALRDIEGLPEAIGSVAQRGRDDWWERGVGLCALIPGVTGKIEGFLGLCKGLEPEAREAPKEIFERIIALIGEMPSSEDRDDLIYNYVQECCRWGIPYLNQAWRSATRIGNEWSRFQALSTVAEGYVQIRDIESAKEVLDHVLEIAVHIENYEHRSEVLSKVVQAYVTTGDTEKATEVLDQAVKAATQIEDEWRRFKSFSTVIMAYAQVGSTEKAIDGLIQISEAAARIGEEWKRSEVLSAVTQAYTYMGNFEKSIDGLDYILEIAVQIQNDMYRSKTIATVARGYTQLGNIEDITDGPSLALKTAAKIENEWIRSITLSDVAQSYARVKEGKTAAMVLGEALGAATQVGDETLRFSALSAVAQGYAEEDVENATSGLDFVLEAMTQLGNKSFRSVGLSVVAQGYFRAGKVDTAVKMLGQVMKTSAQIKNEEFRSKVLSKVARVYVQIGDDVNVANGLGDVLKTTAQLRDERCRSEVISAVVQGYAQIGNIINSVYGLSDVLKTVAGIECELRFMALSVIAEGYAGLGDIDTAAEVLEYALEVVAQFLDERDRPEALTVVAAGYAGLGDIDNAVKVLGNALEIATRIGNEGGEPEDIATWIGNEGWRSEILSAVAQGYVRVGEFKTAAGVAAQIKNKGWRSEVLSKMAQGYVRIGDVETASVVLEQALDIATQIGDKEERSYALSAVSQGYSQVVDAKAASVMLAQALDIATQVGDEGQRCSAIAMVAEGYTLIGDSEIAAEGLFHVLEAMTQISDASYFSQAISLVSQNFVMVGDIKTASEVLGQAMEAVTRTKNEGERSSALSAVVKGYANIIKIPEACNLLSIIFVDEDFLEACKGIFTAVEGLAEEDAPELLLGSLYRVLPLASQHNHFVYLQVVQYALPALVKHLPPDQVRPILEFLEEQWSLDRKENRLWEELSQHG